MPLDVGYLFFGGIQHSPIDGCSAESFNFGVLTGEDERGPSALPSIYPFECRVPKNSKER